MLLSPQATDSEISSLPFKRVSVDSNASILTDIYQADVNIVIWENKLSHQILNDINQIMLTTERLNIKFTAAPDDVEQALKDCADVLQDKPSLYCHIALLTDMFCTLFDLKRVGVRLAILDNAMCPKFHVDKVPCRLITTLYGVATEWLTNHKVDRSKLGAGSLGLPDEISGIIESDQDIKKMTTGDVILLKGEGWYNNENGGAVHRSPAISKNERRLLLTLDFIE
ncbi:DUF1826 domain-containing protein [Colwellia sp. 1_MG-2023]|uniref:DUF1826 domain-containing protein n=1 Tax=Colwellia sp. 1_MG-2023 TaxID=3062649 RepID=UPI0026E460CA|nr:DUF1826 domain-containing protein [Colwellia sp. 1_MG-2023]